MRRRTYDVCAAVVSDMTFDARVWKEVRSLARAGYRVALLGCQYDLDSPRWRDDDGIDVYEVSLGTRGNISRRGRAITLLRLWWQILRTRARVYHAHNIHVGPPAWLASRLRRAALVYDAHELYGPGGVGVGGAESGLGALLARAAGRVERFLVHASDHVVTINDSRAKILEDRHGSRPMVVLQNVPELEEQVTPLDPGFPDGRKVLLYQGGIYAGGRAFPEVMQALHSLDDVDLVLLGFGRPADLDKIRRWASELGVAERVHLLPPRPYRELIHTAAAGHVGLVPLRKDTLGSNTGDGNKLFEYMMAGLPFVATDVPEIRKVTLDGDPQPGELFDPSDIETIVSAVRRVLEDPDLYQERRREARRLAVERYNWNVQERGLLDAYAAMTRKTGPA